MKAIPRVIPYSMEIEKNENVCGGPANVELDRVSRGRIGYAAQCIELHNMHDSTWI